MSTIENAKEVIEDWKSQVLVGPLEEYELEIDEEVPAEYAAATLFLDLYTMKASGNTNDYFAGYSKAASDILKFMGVEIFQDDLQKKVYIKRNLEFDKTQEKLKEFLWGDGN